MALALKPIVESLDDVPEPLRGFYAEKDGKHVLSVDGMVPKDRLAEFRDSNIALRKQVEDLTAKFDGIDPETYRTLSEKAQKERDKKLIDAGKVDDLVAERVTAMKADFDKQLGTVSGERTRLQTQLEGLLIDSTIRETALRSGVRATAVDDVLLRGRQLFRLHDGKAVPMDGDKPVFGKNGEPMEIAEWVSGLAERAPHLFEQSSGGGAGAGKPAAGSRSTVDRTDSKAFLTNLAKIASGEVKVS